MNQKIDELFTEKEYLEKILKNMLLKYEINKQKTSSECPNIQSYNKTNNINASFYKEDVQTSTPKL